MATEQRSVIVGAGLVGSLLAITLKKSGHDVIMYEKRSDMRKEEVAAGRSINLIITSRGLNAVKKVGLLDEVLALTIPVTGRMMHSKEGELTYQPYGKDPSECNYSVSRAELNMLLMTKAEEAGVEIIFDHSLDHLNVEKDELYFVGPNKTERTQKFDRVYGTDGANSQVRRELLKLDSNATDSMNLINADYKELFMPAAANGEYAIEKNALHIWPRGNHMLMALPNLDGSFTMTLYLPRENDDNSFEAMQTKEDLRKYMETNYADSLPLMPKYEEDFFENPQGILGTVRANPWNYSDRICLLGDAAHAVVPFFGQGMNSGFEDVTVLMACLAQTDNYLDAFNKYSEVQKPNGDAIGDMAEENFAIMSEKTADERYLFMKKVENELQKKFPEKFRSKYGMVTYTLVPYSYAQQAGEIQWEILTELCEGKSDVDSIDWAKAEILIDEKLVPFQKGHGVTLERYTF